MTTHYRRGWNPADLDDIAARDIRPERLEQQLDLFANPPAGIHLDRPCSIGDGIQRLTLEEQRAYEQEGRAAIQAGRVVKFVPASGAATRMFQHLAAARRDGIHTQPDALQFLGALNRFAFHDELRGSPQDGQALLAALLDPAGLNFLNLPKALIPFHRCEGRARTAFEEQIREAIALGRDADGVCNIHFTISPEHHSLFEKTLSRISPIIHQEHHTEVQVSFSCQKSSTDTIAADLECHPFRDGQGRLVFRPGGHGALLENLNALNADVVLIRNIDNIAHPRLWPPVLYWKKVLTGLLVEVQRRVHRWLFLLESDDTCANEATRWTRTILGLQVSPDAAALRRALDRPIRVCGVVPNSGEPGGGPFWVRRPDGRVDLQIVESAQVDPSDDQQRALFDQATHFNPVDLACGLLDFKGRRFDLHRFRDPRAVFITRKSYDGRPVLAMELPGLWNGGMADWITLFLEVPAETFNPVKTINDLLRPQHQESTPLT